MTRMQNSKDGKTNNPNTLSRHVADDFEHEEHMDLNDLANRG